MRALTLLQMQYVLEIDRCGSMNKAAQRLFCSQSALSSAIVEVERELGITVFHRSNRGISLTEDGRALVGQITPIVEQSRKLSRYYQSRRTGDFRQLSVAAQHYPFCARAFVELLGELGELPIEHAVRRALEEKQLSFQPLVTLKPHVFLRRGHPLAGESSVRLEQLRPYPHVVFTQPEGDLNFAEEAVAGSGADFPRMIYVSDRATIYNIIAHTDGVSTGSGVLPTGYADEGLTAVPLEGQRDMRLGYIHRKGEALSQLQSRFVALLRKITEEM